MIETLEILFYISIMLEFIILCQFLMITYFGAKRAKFANGMTIAITATQAAMVFYHALMIYDTIHLFQYLEQVVISHQSIYLSIAQLAARLLVISANIMLLVKMWQEKNLPIKRGGSRTGRKITGAIGTIEEHKYPHIDTGKYKKHPKPNIGDE